jgi:DNA modification methylase/DNA-binding XRE family transcriptional regulator
MSLYNNAAAAALLGEEIGRARRLRRVTRSRLAMDAGISRVTLANLEAGGGSVGALVSVLAALECRFVNQPAELAVGRWIAQSRKRLGLSQDRLCARAGVSKPALVRVERCEGNVSTLILAMTGLGLSVSLVEAEIEAVPPSPPTPTARLFHGDCRDHMRDFAGKGLLFDAIVTDPPYHLSSTKRSAKGFMEQAWDGGDIAFDVDTWRAVHGVIKPGGYVIAFGGSRTFHRLAVAIEDAGFEIRDTIMWLFGSGFPKSSNVGRGIEGLKRGNARYSGSVMPSQEVGVQAPGQLLREMATTRWTGRQVRVEQPEAKRWEGHGTALKPGYEPILIARKPIRESSVAANVLRFGTGGINIDACRVPTDEVIEMGRAGRKLGSSVALEGPGLPATVGTKLGRKDGRWPANVIHDGIEEAWGRYFYAAKASKSDRGAGNTHPTVKPNSLMRYLVRLVTPPGGTVFDPFCGSGSSGVAAVQEGFSFAGAEMMSDYIEIARRRIQAVMPAGRSVELDLDEGSGLGKVAL